MDEIRNPYAPGAGTKPAELAGRDDILNKARIAIERIRMGRPSQSIIMVGLRGVGKTVLLDQIRLNAERSGIQSVRIEAPEDRSLPALLAPAIRQALLKLSLSERAQALAERALRALAGFARSMKVKYSDVEVGIDFEPEDGLSDNGDLELDLTSLIEAAGKAAQADNTALVLFIDELQYVKEKELEALISALHRVSQLGLPVTMVGAGLPQLRGRMGNAKSYAERLFVFPMIGALEHDDALKAIVAPARIEEVEFEENAAEKLVECTKGYPYFIQEWGKQVWDLADKSPITLKDCNVASKLAIAALDASFFRVRFDRMTPAEKEYLRAMAELGEGPHRSGDIAKVLGRPVNSLAPTRSNLINKGMVWSPNHGDTAFTVPLFDDFMKRIMPIFK